MLTSPLGATSPVVAAWPHAATALGRELKDKTVLLIEESPSGFHELFELSEYGADIELVRATSSGALDLLETEAVDVAVIGCKIVDTAGTRIVTCLKDRGIPYLVLAA